MIETLLTLKLALVSTIALIILGVPIAYWLAFSKSIARLPVYVITLLPLVLPPTVLGFYLLVGMSEGSWISHFTALFGIERLAFSFSGLVMGSIVYSLPFVVQPVYFAFANNGRKSYEAALSLGAPKTAIFFRVLLPETKNGIIAASLLAFAHTIGEFGVVLMIGGNIPGETRVLSIAIFDLVENLQFQRAHIYSASLLAFSFLSLLLVLYFSGQWKGDRDA